MGELFYTSAHIEDDIKHIKEFAKKAHPNTLKNTHINMDQLLKIAAIQTDIAWEDKKKNVSRRGAHTKYIVQARHDYLS
jgi:hypothetical protein